MKTVNNQSSFPDKPHYAIIIFDNKQIHHEGDERSRTNPGHGYPAYTENVNNFKYLSFDNTNEGEMEWKNKLKDLYIENPKRTDIVGFKALGKVLITPTITIG